MFEPLTLRHGPTWPNRYALAPLTNTQSHPDGTLSDDEHRWLTMRAQGGFGLVMTCASHVQAVGQGFPGQLGIFGDEHLPGLRRLAEDIRSHGSVSSVQLHHAGYRSPADLVGQPVGPSDDEATGSRGLTAEEVEQLAEDFVLAALRAQEAGFDGVEIHGAHGYVLAQFLSSEDNRRTDRYGGQLAGRSRLLLDVVRGIRDRCRPDFQLGLRLSPERFGMRLGEVRELCEELLASQLLDYLDLSLWDTAKQPVEPEFADRPLMQWFTDLERHGARLGVAGKVMTAARADELLEEGADFVMLGRAAILHHDFPLQAARDRAFTARDLPVTAQELADEGLGPAFITYMGGWRGFVDY
ncbi:MAG: NADH:flavin oxidoreductase/NADH oxidase [Frankiales bacterium]|nr:NADH:flavin oxidoreductase/NADH oxidase [Frankiales bacterium]